MKKHGICRKCGGTEFYETSSHCKKCKSIKNAKWRELNQEKIKKFRADNKEYFAIYMVGYRKQNPEKIREINKKSELRNIEKVRERGRLAWHKRRARKTNGNLSKGLIDKLYKLQKGKCACCGKKLGDDYHLDHIMPLALGGEHKDSNIQLLRANCNRQKHAKHPVDFMRQRGFLI